MLSLQEDLSDIGCTKVLDKRGESRVEIGKIESAVVYVVAHWSEASARGLRKLGEAIAKSPRQPSVILLDIASLDHRWMTAFFSHIKLSPGTTAIHAKAESLWIKNGNARKAITHLHQSSVDELSKLVAMIAADEAS